MKNTLIISIVFCVLLISAQSSKADLVFYDDFDSYATSIPWSGAGNWTVTETSVDLIGEGSSWDLLPGNGHYLDMDGSTFNAGTVESIGIALAPGDYNLIFDLAGSRRSSSPYDSVIVQVNGFVNVTLSDIPYDAPFSTVSMPFTVATAATTKISFNGLGEDNMGVLIDNVGIENVVPVPGAFILGSLGLSFAGWKLRRRKLL